MSVMQLFQFSCDDHGHDEEESPGEPQIPANSKKEALAKMIAAGWTFHRDGRSFCGACNARLAKRTSQGERDE